MNLLKYIGVFMSHYNVEQLELFQEFKKLFSASEQIGRSSLKIASFMIAPPIQLLKLMLDRPRLRKNLAPGKWIDVPGNQSEYVSPFWRPPSSNDI
tara:strand:- start:14566 stop:14853 length:288 start_codon:yes stop_codon:yes gene_type:complete